MAWHHRHRHLCIIQTSVRLSVYPHALARTSSNFNKNKNIKKKIIGHYYKNIPIMPALCSMLQHTYYARNYAGIYNVPKPKQQPWWTMQPLTDHDPVLGSTVSYYLV